MSGFVRDALLAALVGFAFLSTAALVRLRSGLDALHALGFLGLVCGALLLVAVLVSQGLATVAFKAAFLFIVLLGGGAAVMHATGRALFLRRTWEADQ